MSTGLTMDQEKLAVYVRFCWGMKDAIFKIELG